MLILSFSIAYLYLQQAVIKMNWNELNQTKMNQTEVNQTEPNQMESNRIELNRIVSEDKYCMQFQFYVTSFTCLFMVWNLELSHFHSDHSWYLWCLILIIFHQIGVSQLPNNELYLWYAMVYYQCPTLLVSTQNK